MISDTGQAYNTGTILESQPLKRLVIQWQNHWKPELKAEGDSLCTFDIEAAEEATKLTVTHSMNRNPSKLIEAVSGGWPRIISNLKSLLETGQVVMATKKCA